MTTLHRPPRAVEPENDARAPRLLVTLTVDELGELIEAAMARAMQAQPVASPYMRREQAAQYLDCSLPTLDRWIREDGLPYVLLGDSRRFVREALDAWVASRSAAKEEA